MAVGCWSCPRCRRASEIPVKVGNARSFPSPVTVARKCDSIVFAPIREVAVSGVAGTVGGGRYWTKPRSTTDTRLSPDDVARTASVTVPCTERSSNAVNVCTRWRCRSRRRDPECPSPQSTFRLRIALPFGAGDGDGERKCCRNPGRRSGRRRRDDERRRAGDVDGHAARRLTGRRCRWRRARSRAPSRSTAGVRRRSLRADARSDGCRRRCRERRGATPFASVLTTAAESVPAVVDETSPGHRREQVAVHIEHGRRNRRRTASRRNRGRSRVDVHLPTAAAPTRIFTAPVALVVAPPEIAVIVAVPDCVPAVNITVTRPLVSVAASDG